MSILIKGMKMPTSCYNCRLRYFDGEDDVCAFGGEIMHGEERCDDCPLVPVPPHGRLIDADELLRYKEREVCSAEKIVSVIRYVVDIRYIKDAPTVIEAEEGE